MEAAKHTKGPWRVQRMGAQEADLMSGGTFMGLNGGSGCPDKYEPDDAAEWEANVRLIAAAPDLKSAAIDCAEYLESLIAEMGDCPAASGEDGWCSKLCESYGCMKMRSDHCRAALSKAGV